MMEPGVIFGLLVTLICVGVFTYLVHEFFRRRRIKGSGWSAQGTIVRTWTSTRTNRTGSGFSDTTTDHHAEAAYATHWGEARTVRLDGEFRHGDHVTVRYDQRDGYVPLLGRKSSAGSGCGGCLGFILVVVIVVVIASIVFAEVGGVVSDTLNDVLSLGGDAV